MTGLRSGLGLIGAALDVAMLAAPSPAQTVTARVSVDSSGAQAKGASDGAGLSSDGRIFVFNSVASNLVSGDTNGVEDAFLHDRTTGVTERVSVDSAGAEGNGPSACQAVSADGRYVLFTSLASNLVSGDTNGTWDVFVRDRAAGTTERVSVDSNGGQGDGASYGAALSADGGVVLFSSDATDLVTGDTNRCRDVFLHDRSSGVTLRISVSDAGYQAAETCNAGPGALSADGSRAVFTSLASNLVAGDGNGTCDVFVHDLLHGTTTRVSVDASGGDGDDESGVEGAAISGDGSVVAFASAADNLVDGDTNGVVDIFVCSSTGGSIERVSVDSGGAQAISFSGGPALSADGRVVVFDSFAANLVAGDSNGVTDVFLHDRATGLTERADVDSDGAEAIATALAPRVSADGTVVAFQSCAPNLVSGDTNQAFDVFFRDRCATVATWSNYGDGVPGTNGVPSITATAPPVVGTTVTIVVQNSYGRPTDGLLFLGAERSSVPSVWGGELLVDPSIVLPITFWYGSDTFQGDLPFDYSLGGMTFDLQAFEHDPGAPHGVSFTPGLELIVGK
jgi:Tol biopolymer transport system component